MKTKRHCIVLLFVIVLMIPFSSYATDDDTDVYDISQDVQPNVLIIFDNSGSMDAGVPYNDSDTYAGSYNNGPTDYYERECLDWGYYGCRDWGPWEVYTGTFTDTNSDGIHDSDTNIRKGNRLNYDYGDYDNRLGVAKQAINDIIDQTKDDVRFGIMVLNGGVPINPSSNWPNYYNYQTDTTVLSSGEGGAIIEDRDNAEIETLKGFINGMTADGGTPLTNRLINAALYFRGDFGSYASPLETDNWCRDNFVIIMTDGTPEGEGDYRDFPADGQGTRWANNNGEYEHIETFLDDNPGSRDVDSDSNDPDPDDDYTPNGGSDYLDDVAYYLNHTEDSIDPSHAIEGNQNLIIYTIGYHVDHQLLSDTAANGGGDYYTTSSSLGLTDALATVMEDIVDRAQTFTAPVVPVQRTTSGDKMYISLFTPRSTAFWPGYLVKLKIGTNGELTGFDSAYGTGDEMQVTDSYGTLHEDLLQSGDPPYPYWDAHYVLKQRVSARNIYTYFTGNTTDLNDPSDVNAFTTGNTTYLTAAVLGNPTEGSNPRDDLINYIRGKDAYDEDGDEDVGEKRDEILGDILHSKPLIVDYEASNTSNPHRVIYVGTNDGMLHAFDDTDGSEKWAFIPPDLLPTLKNLTDEVGHQYYVDGSPQAYILDNDGDGDIETPDQDTNYDKVYIIFGERRGGSSYCALDVSNPDDPQFMWRIDNTVADYTEMGQSWSDPVIGKVKTGTVGSETDMFVACISGGHSSDNTKGRAVYLINVLDGSLVKSFTSSDHANLTYSIPSTVLAADTTFDGYINRVYVGDLGGQMWRFGLHRNDSNDTRLEDGNIDNWTARRLFQGYTGTKIFYPPDMVLEPGYAYLYFGTGDRTDPMSDTGADRFYAVKDRNETIPDFNTRVGAEGTLIEADDLENVTDDVLQDPSSTATEIQQKLANLYNKDGWYIVMENTGEKVLAPATVIYGMLLFTTFTPLDTVAYPCSYGGDARLYAVNYLTAVSIIDWGNNGLDKADRSIHIGQGIPTEVVITISDTGEVRGYVGAGGGIIHWDFTGSVPGFRIDAWREAF